MSSAHSSNASPSSSPKRRPHSEAPPLSARWRIVGGWSSLRRPHPKRTSPSNSPAPSGLSSRRDSTIRRDTTVAEQITSRHRISLFLRRGRSRDAPPPPRTPPEPDPHHASPLLRRARSHLVKSVGDRPAGEGARYVQYAAELDDASVHRLRLGAHTNTNLTLLPDHADEHHHEHQLIGQICLADFADADDDFDLLDGQSIDVAFEPASLAVSSRASLKLDSAQLRWIGDEKEFAAFFAQVGLDELWDNDHQQWDEFLVDQHLLDEWMRAGEEHNTRCALWNSHLSLPDIRDVLPEFEQRVAARAAHCVPP